MNANANQEAQGQPRNTRNTRNLIPFEEWWLDVRNVSVQCFGQVALRSLTEESKDAWRPRWERGLTPAQAITEDLDE